MKNDSRLSRRRMALIGIGAVGVVGLALIALWRNSPPPPTKEALAPIDWARSRSMNLDMAKLLEEVHRKEGEEMDRWMRLSPEERIDEKNISPEEKNREKQALQKEMERRREYQSSVDKDLREVEEYMREEDEKLAKTPAREKPKKANLRLVVETASLDLLPAQSLVANVHLINDGQEAVALRTSLYCNLRACVKRPGTQDYVKASLTNISHCVVLPAISLNSGARWSFQTDLPLDLGYNYSTNVVILGEYRVRLELTIRDRDDVVADEFTVRVAAPTVDDETVQRQIFAAGLHGFLGPDNSGKHMYHLWAQPDENLQMTPMIADMFVGYRQAVLAVEDLCRRFPNSRYAPDLRAGFVRAALNKRGGLAPSPEARVDLERRIRVMCQTMMDRDGPKSWARAEILLLVGDCADELKDLPFTKKELLIRFASLCPTDIRIPELAPFLKNREPKEAVDFFAGMGDLSEEDKEELKKMLKDLSEEDKEGLIEMLQKTPTQK